MRTNEPPPGRPSRQIACGLLLGLVLLGGSLPGANPPDGPRWGPLRPGDEVSLRESGGFFALDAGPSRGARAADAGRGLPGLPPGQLGFVLRRIETQPQGTFLVLGPVPPARPEQDFETWIPVAFVRQIRVWP
jgi:hypothetical protein